MGEIVVFYHLMFLLKRKITAQAVRKICNMRGQEGQDSKSVLLGSEKEILIWKTQNRPSNVNDE